MTDKKEQLNNLNKIIPSIKPTGTEINIDRPLEDYVRGYNNKVINAISDTANTKSLQPDKGDLQLSPDNSLKWEMSKEIYDKLPLDPKNFRDFMIVCMFNQKYKNGSRPYNTNIAISDYLNLIGKESNETNRKIAIKNLNEMGDILTTAKISYVSKDKKGKVKDFDYMNIFGRARAKGQKAIFNFTPDFYDHVMSHVMPVPYLTDYFTMPLNKSKYAPAIFTHILIVKNAGADRDTDNSRKIRVKSLIEHTDIPSSAYISQNGRHFKRQIIDPFFSALNFIQDYTKRKITFEILKDGKPFTKEPTIDIFYNLIIKFTFSGYQDQTKRIVTKNKKIQNANRAKHANAKAKQA